MAQEHLDGLAEELNRLGIATLNKVSEGVWEGEIDTTRIFNRDETPQFINYGVGGTGPALSYCGRGEECLKLIKENRDSVTIEPFIGIDGSIPMCHVIFATSGLTSHMIPKSAVEAIPNLILSATANGYQDQKSCLQSYKQFNNYLIKEKIKKPVVMLTDGHSSRFTLPVVKFCQSAEIYQFVSPPDTTAVTQVLDQVNSSLQLTERRSGHW